RPARIGFAPMVAEQPVKLLLPAGYQAISFDVQYGDLISVDKPAEVKPFRPAVRIGAKPAADYYTYRHESYNTDAYFPGFTRSKWFTNQSKHGHTILVSSLFPVQYNPVTAELAYHKSMTVTVQLEKMREEKDIYCTPSIKSELESFVDNKEAVKNLPLSKNRADYYEYLIITTDALKDGWSAFVEFNTRRGLRTQIQTIPYIKSNVSGVDDPDKVRNYIVDQYTNNKITYVMLGSDENPSNANDVPDRSFRAQMYDNFVSPERFTDEKNLSACIYFEGLDGDWKGSNTYYGEPGSEDMAFEVLVGRFPADNTTDLTNIISKTIKFCETPVTDVNNLLLAGNFLWDDYGVACYGGDNVEEHVGTCNHNAYTTIGFPANEWDIDRLYEKNGSWSVSTFRSRINTNKPQWIIHDGHGNTTYFAGETNSGVTTNNYKNNGTNANFFFILTGACDPGNFDGSSDCVLEEFVNLSTGAYACIGNDHSGWGDDDGTDGCTHRPYRYMTDAMFNPEHQMHHIEAMHAFGKEACSDIVLNKTLNDPPYFGCITYCIYETNLLGDPAVSIWTKTPENFNESFSITNKVFNCETKRPYTWVALCKPDGSILTTQLTGKDGVCKIDDSVLADYLTANPGVTLKVRIKAHNCLPFESDLATDISNVVASKTYDSFNATTKTVRIKYTLDAQGLVNISVFNSKGVLVKTLVNGYQNIGTHDVVFNNSNLSNGIYYCRMAVNNSKKVEKFVVSK
ncbi:C25 family cysteine peptidase, partial [Fibrobacterota bacterium]